MDGNSALPRRLTIEEWEALPEDLEGELVDGWLVEEEMPDGVHETVVTWLVLLFGPWARPRGGKVFASELKLRLSATRGRKGDVSVWFPGHPRLPPHRAVPSPPDLLVEVVSRGRADARRDCVEKRADWAAFGVRWYWLVDPEARTLEILELGRDGYASALVAARGRLDAVPGCPGLVLDLDDLWAAVDELLDDGE